MLAHFRIPSFAFRTFPAVLAAMLVLAAAQAVRADPTTRPGGNLRFTDADVRAAAKLAGVTGLRQWAPAIVETFNAKPDKLLWSGGKISFEPGGMVAVFEGDANVGRQFVLQRPLPEELRKADGIQVQMWLQVDPVVRKINNRVIGMYTMQLGLGEGDGRPAIQHWFAYSTNGIYQRISAPDMMQSRMQRTEGLAAGKLVHLQVELVGRRISCLRDDSPIDCELTSNAVSHLGDRPMVSIIGNLNKVRLVKATYRALAKPTDGPVAWHKTAFESEEQFTRHLAGQVIPRLNSPLYQERESANRLLESVWPLPRTVVNSQLSRRPLAPELEARLKALAEKPVQEKVEPPAKNDPADADPVGVKDLPVTTQPDEDGAKIRIRQPIREPVMLQPAE
jgi:hypothetical protein